MCFTITREGDGQAAHTLGVAQQKGAQGAEERQEASASVFGLESDGAAKLRGVAASIPAAAHERGFVSAAGRAAAGWRSWWCWQRWLRELSTQTLGSATPVLGVEKAQDARDEAIREVDKAGALWRWGSRNHCGASLIRRWGSWPHRHGGATSCCHAACWEPT